MSFSFVYLASTTITIVLPLGNNTINNYPLVNITNLFPNTTNGTITIDVVK